MTRSHRTSAAARIAILASLAITATSTPRVLGAQVATRTLATPENVFDASFTAITGLRELADGRVIVADGREKTLQVLDPRTSAAMPVGREGGGPAEWSIVSRLFRMPGDSTVMVDFGNSRYFVIGPDAKPATTFRITDASVSRGQLVGVDGRGRFYFEQERLSADANERGGSTGVFDIVRFDRVTRRADTLARFDRVKGERSSVTAIAGGMLQRYTNLPLATLDVVAIAFDGRIAIARGTGYRVEWISPDGRLTRGPAAQASAIRVTQAEKDAFIKGQRVPGQIYTRPGNGGAEAGGARGPTSSGAIPLAGGAPGDEPMTWPAIKPPFLNGAAQVAPDGRLWVLRTRAHDDSIPTYDVFDATGKVAERVALPKATRLVGFGKDAVYLARTDEDELLRLERHRFK